MGKKDPCAVFGCNNDRLFLEKYTAKNHISNTKLEKGDYYYIQTRHKDLFFRRIGKKVYCKGCLRPFENTVQTAFKDL